MLSILDVPPALCPAPPFPYPGHQRGPLVEEFAAGYLRAHADDWPLDHDWTYIPAYWTNYACRLSLRRRFGRKLARRRMQRFLQTLPSGRRYFTVSQHDDGLNQRGAYRPNRPIYEFSAGGVGDLPIPLLCDPHVPMARSEDGGWRIEDGGNHGNAAPSILTPQASRLTPDGGNHGNAAPSILDPRSSILTARRDLRASFVGALSTATHRYPIRDAMAAALAGRREYLIRDVTPAWGEADRRSLADKTADFIDTMCRSVFALCPRGYGKTSFRLYEAMQLGCVPVYLYDEPWLPYADAIDWNEICVLVHASQIDRLHDILASKTDRDIAAMRRRIAELWPDYFTLAGVMQQLPRYLNAAASGRLHTPTTARHKPSIEHAA